MTGVPSPQALLQLPQQLSRSSPAISRPFTLRVGELTKPNARAWRSDFTCVLRTCAWIPIVFRTGRKTLSASPRFLSVPRQREQTVKSRYKKSMLTHRPRRRSDFVRDVFMALNQFSVCEVPMPACFSSEALCATSISKSSNVRLLANFLDAHRPARTSILGFIEIALCHYPSRHSPTGHGTATHGLANIDQFLVWRRSV